jgi:hypothetical protein
MLPDLPPTVYPGLSQRQAPPDKGKPGALSTRRRGQSSSSSGDVRVAQRADAGLAEAGKEEGAVADHVEVLTPPRAPRPHQATTITQSYFAPGRSFGSSGPERAGRGHQATLTGPLPGNPTRQHRDKDGYARGDFRTDSGRQEATCPQGQAGKGRHGPCPASSPGAARFTRARCQPCPVRAACATSRDGARNTGFPRASSATCRPATAPTGRTPPGTSATPSGPAPRAPSRVRPRPRHAPLQLPRPARSPPPARPHGRRRHHRTAQPAATRREYSSATTDGLPGLP